MARRNTRASAKRTPAPPKTPTPSQQPTAEQEVPQSPSRLSDFQSPSGGEETDYNFTFEGRTNANGADDFEMDLTAPGNGRVSVNQTLMGTVVTPEEDPIHVEVAEVSARELSPQPGTSRATEAPPAVPERRGRPPSSAAPRRGRPTTAAATNREPPATDRRRARKQAQPKKRDAHWLQEVRRLQRTTENLVPRLPFSRLVREVMYQNSRTGDLRITKEALRALQESAELYLTHFFQDANRLVTHAKRVTLMPRDMKLIYELRTNWGLC